MDKVIDLVYYGETHVPNAFKKKVMSALEYFQVENLDTSNRPMFKVPPPPPAFQTRISKAENQTKQSNGELTYILRNIERFFFVVFNF